MGIVLRGSGMSNALEPEDGDGARSGGVCGRDGADELVEVSQPPPEEQREEMSPSRAACASLDESREDLPDEPPRDEPPREEHSAVELVALLRCPLW